MEAIDYSGSLTGLTSLLKAMEIDGQIRREINGKRCFSISVTNQNQNQNPVRIEEKVNVRIPEQVESIAEAPPARQPIEEGLDVSAIAKALLDQVIDIAGTPRRDKAEIQRLNVEIKTMQQRLFEATERAEKARQRLRLAEDELVAKKVESDGLRQRLRETERNLDAIIKSPNGVRLDLERERELRDLIRMMKAPTPNA